ncbi:DUF4097 family beta strand repeat-containing protein [Streptomyces sp. NPDC088789]|uniref:DUF4097 family beta strand repeat-containing protein n=1 Tax=Streptomyces sp. NPDC088789 TaxID=3365899 RepID=UPI0037FFAA0D
MQKFDTPTQVSAVVDIPAGRIQFIAADRTDTTVEILPADATRSRDVQAAEQITVGHTDGVLRIEAQAAKSRILGSSGAVEVTVRLPAGSRVEAKAASADLGGVGRLGDVAFEGAQGTVKLDEATGVRLTLDSGDVSVGRLGGSGEISVKKGEIRIAEAAQGTVTLRTEQGGISVGAARGTSATLDASTTLGRVINTLNNTDGPDAGLTIRATTAHGDITARSL